jgi:hypothetical protein
MLKRCWYSETIRSSPAFPQANDQNMYAVHYTFPQGSYNKYIRYSSLVATAADLKVSSTRLELMAWNPPANTSETSADVPGKQGRTRGYSILSRGDRVTEFGGEIPPQSCRPSHVYTIAARLQL